MNDRHDGNEPVPMDPVALTLAVWLGLIVGVTGLVRMSENAAAQAAIAQAGGRPPEARQSVDAGDPFSARLMAFGG